MLFNLVINDIIDTIPSKKIFYANDGVFCVTDSSLDGCVTQMDNVIHSISTFLLNNKLVRNIGKTEFMLFTPFHVNILQMYFFLQYKASIVQLFLN